MRSEILMHESYRPQLEEELAGYSISPAVPEFLPLTLQGIPIRFSPYVPATFPKDRWIPPEGDRFCSYEESDEEWMRPLGLGTVVQEQHPCYFKVQVPDAIDFIPELGEPKW